MTEILTVSSSASATETAKGNVLVSGSYGGEYNAWHAAKWGIRGVVLCDAGVGLNDAGINGLPYLDRIGLAAATADAFTCHIADAEHMLAHGRISHVNASAAKLGCKVGQSVAECANLMKAGPVINEKPPEIAGGKRFVILDSKPPVLGLDAAPLLTPDDKGAIAVTASHAALFRGQPDGIIGPDLYAVFFNDAGVGMDEAGISRLPTLDERGIAAGAVSAASASIGKARSSYETGILSHVNETARKRGARSGMPLRDFIEMLLADYGRQI
ncbi:MAG: hypothetical protein H6873_07505 [Hyphomicrobiaceae bacterium]|nr:hypothetical protein [Hyphomicrobiaceae bacterium]